MKLPQVKANVGRLLKLDGTLSLKKAAVSSLSTLVAQAMTTCSTLGASVCGNAMLLEQQVSANIIQSWNSGPSTALLLQL